MDGIRRAVGGESKAKQTLQVTTDRRARYGRQRLQGYDTSIRDLFPWIPALSVVLWVLGVLGPTDRT